MTDETQTEAIPAPDPEPDKGVSLIQLWAIYYETALSFMVGNTLNKQDKQQYRLKAADVALGLAKIQTGLGQ